MNKMETIYHTYRKRIMICKETHLFQRILRRKEKIMYMQFIASDIIIQHDCSFRSRVVIRLTTETGCYLETHYSGTTFAN